MTSAMSCCASSASTCSMIGRLATGTIGLGTSYVSGRNRVPSPAAMTIAFIEAQAIRGGHESQERA